MASASNLYARVARRPAMVPMVPGILLLVPGSLGFRSLTSLIDAAIAELDDRFAELLASLEASGHLENTVVVLWGDHGYHLGEQGLWTKANNYEQSTRVPLIVAPPMFAGTSAVVRGDDLHRMILQLAGLGSGPEPQLEPGELFLGDEAEGHVGDVGAVLPLVVQHVGGVHPLAGQPEALVGLHADQVLSGRRLLPVRV